MIELFAISVFDALVAIAHRASPAIGEAADHLREAARPPRGVELRSDDGSLFTGIVVVDKNRPVLMLAVRMGERRPEPDRRPLVTPPPDPRSPYFGGQRSLHLDPDDARWDYPDPYAPR